MPEGPSIVILREEADKFTGKKVIDVSGNSRAELSMIRGKTIKKVSSWGKLFFICFEEFFLRIHLLMWGTYIINGKKEREPRLHLQFRDGELNFYSCSVRLLDGKPEEIYDPSRDVMSDAWDPVKTHERLLFESDEMICDVLLDQQVFSGVGNIIKNEVLYREHLHPESLTGSLPGERISALIMETRSYSFEFLELKRKHELKKHWLVHNKKTCLRCNLPLVRKQTGKRNRRSFFCTNCQVLYSKNL